jgi:hypothetical protein
MQVFVGIWRPTEQWLSLSRPARTAYLSKLSAATRLRLGTKAESIAWAENINPDSSERTQFFCVWRFPNEAMSEQYLSVLAEHQWNDYFETESFYGAPKTPFDVMTKHVML